MMSLWKLAIESSKAMVLDEINLAPKDLLKKVEEFEGISQATEDPYPALILASEDDISISVSESEEVDIYSDDYDEIVDDYDDDNNDIYYSIDSSIPLGSLPIDVIPKKLDQD